MLNDNNGERAVAAETGSAFRVGSICSPGMNSSLRQDWATPTQLFWFLDREFCFQLDACADPRSHRCLKWFGKEEDSLKQNWHPWTPIWCNPPYGRKIGDWIHKGAQAARLGSTVVMLLPARTDTKWFHDYCLKGEIRFLRGRLRFDDDRRGRCPFPSMIVVFRPPEVTL